MSFAPLNTSLIETRLTEQISDLQQVLGAADYNQVQKLGDFRVGTAYVVLAAETNAAASGPQARNAVAAAAVFGVIICARNYRDSLGSAALDEASVLAGAVREALIGWAPQGWHPCKWLQGNVHDSDQSRVLWIDVFTTTHVLGAQR